MKVKKDARFKAAYRMGKHERAVYLEEHPEEYKRVNQLVRGTQFAWEAPVTCILLIPVLLLYVFIFQDGFQTSGLTMTLANTFLCAICLNALAPVLADYDPKAVTQVICALVMPVCDLIITLICTCFGFFTEHSETIRFILAWSVAWIAVFITLCRGDILLAFHPKTAIFNIIALALLLVCFFFTGALVAFPAWLWGNFGELIVVCLIVGVLMLLGSVGS